MTIGKLNSSPSLRIFEAGLWYTYLVCLIVVSFINVRIDSLGWLYFCGVYFCLFAMFILSGVMGAHQSRLALEKAKWIVFAMLAILILLILQRLLPSEYLIGGGVINATAPSWFDPALRLSVTPEKTRWLWLSESLVLCWFVMGLLIITTRRRIKQIMLVLMFVGVVHASAGIYAYYTNIHLVDLKQLDGHYRIARGWFINRNHFAGFLNITLVSCLFWAFRDILKSRSNRGSYLTTVVGGVTTLSNLAISGLLVVGLLLSQSRGGVASLVIAILAVVCSSSLFKLSIRPSLKLLLPLSLVVVCGLHYFGQDLLQRLTSGLFSLGERTTQWSLTWELIRQAPLLGYGGGSYGEVFQLVRDYADLRQVSYRQSHNQYLHVWLEQGLLGLLLLLFIIIQVFRYSFSVLRKTTSTLVNSVVVASLIVISASLLQAGVDFNLQILNIRIYFFTVIVLIFAAPNLKEHHLHRRKAH